MFCFRKNDKEKFEFFALLATNQPTKNRDINELKYPASIKRKL